MEPLFSYYCHLSGQQVYIPERLARGVLLKVEPAERQGVKKVFIQNWPLVYYTNVAPLKMDYHFPKRKKWCVYRWRRKLYQATNVLPNKIFKTSLFSILSTCWMRAQSSKLRRLSEFRKACLRNLFSSLPELTDCTKTTSASKIWPPRYHFFIKYDIKTIIDDDDVPLCQQFAMKKSSWNIS